MWNESSISDLYRSAVDAFPETRKRQHATGTVEVNLLEWMPFLGMNTLFLRASVDNSSGGGGQYQPLILFKKVRYLPNNRPGAVQVEGMDGRTYYLEQITRNQDVLVRCSCGDFHWRFNYYNHLDESLYGRKRSQYQGEYRINPLEMPGMCKHIMKVASEIRSSGLMV